jgi:hypothetical protein
MSVATFDLRRDAAPPLPVPHLPRSTPTQIGWSSKQAGSWVAPDTRKSKLDRGGARLGHRTSAECRVDTTLERTTGTADLAHEGDGARAAGDRSFRLDGTLSRVCSSSIPLSRWEICCRAVTQSEFVCRNLPISSQQEQQRHTPSTVRLITPDVVRQATAEVSNRRCRHRVVRDELEQSTHGPSRLLR